MPSTHPQPLTFPSPPVQTTTTLIVPQNLSRTGLSIYNPSANITIAICPADTVPTIGGAGTITLPPGVGIDLPGWTCGVNAVASLAGASVTVYEQS